MAGSEVDLSQLAEAIEALVESNCRALSLIEIAHRRDLAHDPGYQDLISEAKRYARRAARLLRGISEVSGRTGSRETVVAHKYL